MEEKKILFIKKRTSNPYWSDVLEIQYNDLSKTDPSKFELFEISTNSFSEIISNTVRLRKILRMKSFDCIYVNHAICALICLPVIAFSKYHKTLAIHEGEHVLGLSFGLKNFTNLKIKELLRYTFIYPFTHLFFDRILCLNERQIPKGFLFKKSKYIQMNFLGIDPDIFKPRKSKEESNKSIKVFFPNNPKRPEKRYKIAYQLTNNSKFEIDLFAAGSINHQNLVDYYSTSNIVIFTSEYESYSLAFIESMATNNFIISTENIGILENIKKSKSLNELRDAGIYQLGSSTEFDNILGIINERIINNQKAETRNLFLSLRLDRNSVNSSLFKYLSTTCS